MEKTALQLSVVAVVISGGKMLLVQEKKDRERWMFPGNYLRGFETPEEAIERIIEVDLGLKIKVSEVIGTKERPRFRGGKRVFVWSIWFQAFLEGRISEVVPRKRYEKAMWVSREKVWGVIPDSVREWLPYQVQSYLML